MAVQNIRLQQFSHRLSERSRPTPVPIGGREAWEVGVCRLAGSIHMPVHAIPSGLPELDPDAGNAVICHHGSSSLLQVAASLESKDFAKLHNLARGVDAGARQMERSRAIY